MQHRIIQAVIIIVLLFGVGFVVYSNITNSKSRIIAGEEAPNFTLKNIEGKELSLSDFRGKGIAINFWATFCIPCLEEMPALQRQYEKYKDKGIMVIGVNTGEDAVSVLGYINRLSVKYPILLDREYKVVDLYEVGPIPHTVFIYPDGRVKNVIIGQLNEKTIEKNLLEILPR